MRDDLSALILAGGEGRRMGRPKAFAPFLGEPLLARALRTARAVASEVVLSCGPLADARPWLDLAPDARLVPDLGGGPMSGLRAGAAAATAEWLLVMPVDMPLATPALLEALAQAARGRDAAMPRHEGIDQPLLACYRRAPLMRAAAQARLPRDLAKHLNVARLDGALVASLPHGENALRDADTPDALAALEAVAQSD